MISFEDVLLVVGMLGFAYLLFLMIKAVFVR